MQVITIGGQPVKTNADGLVRLTDMYQAACRQGWGEGKLEPKKWGQAPHAKKSGSTGKTSVSGGPGYDFIDFVRENLKVNAADVYKAVRGKHGGGTFAHWQIALAYAKYLSPELHMLFMQKAAGGLAKRSIRQSCRHKCQHQHCC